MKKIRLDELVKKQHDGWSKSKAQDYIKRGFVQVNNIIVKKPGVTVLETAVISIIPKKYDFVSRAGDKLAHALDQFEIDVSDLIVLDSGLSTGGFSDCLLQRGVKKIYGVEVGTNQLHQSLCNESRLVVFEQTDVRTVELPEQVDMITLDLSFISVLKVIPSITKWLKSNGKLVVLIKPQFEVGKEGVSKSGVVKTESLRVDTIQKIADLITLLGFSLQQIVTSSLSGKDGNIESVAYFIKK